jgi:hypothetical protein
LLPAQQNQQAGKEIQVQESPHKESDRDHTLP